MQLKHHGRYGSRLEFFDELLVPKLENDERPHFLKSGKLAPFLQIYNFFNRLPFEKPAACGIARQQQVPHEIPQFSSKPRLRRQWKAFFRPTKNGRWNRVTHSLP